MSTKNIYKYINLISLCILLILTSCDKAEETETKEIRDNYCLDDNFKDKVSLVKPEEKQATKQIHLTGAVEANPDQVIPFISLVDGVIVNTYFSLGDKVKKGQVLIDLRSADLSELQSDYKSIKAELKVSQRQLQSANAGFEDGISSEKELIQAQSDVAVLKAKKEKISTIMSIYSASSERGVFQIKASATGIITQKNISNGMQISAHHDALYTISNLKEVWVLADIHATNISLIEEEMPVSIKTLSYPDQLFDGKIANISQVFSDQSKVLKARIVLENADLKLKPGMTVDIYAHQDLGVKAMSIPTDAIVFDNNQDYIIIYKSDCDMQIQPADILTKNNGEIFVTNNFADEDQVVNKNQLLIYEQLKNFQK